MKASAHNRLRASGFTLIEVMVTVAIIAILAAVAYPSYQEHVRKGHRAKAQSLLMDMAMRQNQRMLDVRSYADLATLGIAIPPEVAGFYNVTVALVPSSSGPPPTPPRFTVNAIPQGSQANDKCGSLSINEAGTKNPANCW